MPRKTQQAAGLGRSLIKDRFGKKQSTYTYVHVADIALENDVDLNLNSVTELNSMDDFLATAKLAGTEFTAERLNVHFVDLENQGILDESEQERIEKVQNEFRHLLGIPRRPEWDENTSKGDLDEKERDSFLAWRRELATLQDNDDLVITPYEKNLDFWRQLWRVIERSDVIVQIVDGRDPLLFRCHDLETYVKEVDPEKQNIILVNKADLLSAKQRKAWKEYFDANDVRAVFFSAILENEKLELENSNNVHGKPDDVMAVANGDVQEDVINVSSDVINDDVTDVVNDDVTDVVNDDVTDGINDDVTEEEATTCDDAEDTEDLGNDENLLDRKQMIKFFKSLVGKKSKVIGMVGYPNVGKSSTVNTLMGVKKAPVSATPGRTKHFQTLLIDEELCLCDCPGLVFPTFLSSKAEMVLSGILPIDRMRDHVGPMNQLSRRIPRLVVEGTYGINVVRPKEGEDPNRPPTSSEILNAHALSRGFMTSHGQPDNARSARMVLKDYVNGKLLYSKAPPGADEDEYKSWTISKVDIAVNTMGDSLEISDEMESIVARIKRVNKKVNIQVNEVEKEFFNPEKIRTFTAGKSNPKVKGNKKHFNNKREKIRRVRKVEY